MFGSIKYNLTHLFDFRGRDARQTFWYYVLFLVILGVVGWVVALVPLVGSAIEQAMKAAQAGLPQDQVSARMVQGMGPGMVVITWFSAISSLLLTLLTLAAFVRRLHDSDNPGWWAGLVLVAKLITVTITIQSIGKIEAALQAAADPARMQQFQQAGTTPLQALASLAGWLIPLVVIIFGVLPSTDGPNRYGDTSVEF
ncbi:MAG: DUF805 domain-containing protein [Candidatus Andeanibacterium colombiense]|uniref:DUF805 domain-containing protein n=1 Tax=Candidatus Andeanibacterium colombiense TaxID=3121345 RepID=A0AAJ5X9G1_9SPHN|nr:MAG: DUF805 domain-containing protein [Sphingomonadaceae bacterium]